MPKKRRFDIDALKRCSILHVAESLGVELVRTASGEYSVKNREDPRGHNSITIFERTNSFVRWSGKEQGGCSKGSVIDFVRHLTNNPDFRDACTFLSKL